jgi:hypothetical protein
MNPHVIRASLWSALLTVAVAVSACSGPAESTYAITPPSREAFPPVGDVLEAHCGTIDCHGTLARNMRIYGIYGLRFDPKGVTGRLSTTPAEYDATYEAVVSIEPERLSDIVRNQGKGIDDWIVLAKGRGVQHHKGGTQLVKGQPADLCIVAWVMGQTGPQVDNACVQGSVVTPPGGLTW